MNSLAVVLPLSLAFLSGCLVKAPVREEEPAGHTLAGAIVRDFTRSNNRERALQARAEYELGCTGEIEVLPVGAGAYVASGCGDRVTLICSEARRAVDEPTCIREK